MAVLTTYDKQRILYYSSRGHSAAAIQKLLEEEGILISRVSVWKFLRHFKLTDCLARKEGSYLLWLAI